MIFPALLKIITSLATTARTVKGVATTALRAKKAGGLTKNAAKFLTREGYPKNFIQKLDANITFTKNLSEKELLKTFKSFRSAEVADIRYAKAVEKYNNLVDKNALENFARNIPNINLVRIVEAKPLDKIAILKKIKQYNYRSINLSGGYNGKRLQSFIQYFSKQGLHNVAEYLNYLKNSRGALREKVNESLRSGDLQTMLNENYENRDEKVILDILENYFSDENVAFHHREVVENKKLLNTLTTDKKQIILSKIRKQTFQQVAKTDASLKARRNKR